MGTAMPLWEACWTSVRTWAETRDPVWSEPYDGFIEDSIFFLSISCCISPVKSWPHSNTNGQKPTYAFAHHVAGHLLYSNLLPKHPLPSSGHYLLMCSHSILSLSHPPQHCPMGTPQNISRNRRQLTTHEQIQRLDIFSYSPELK